MSPQLISIVVLLAMFIVASALPINLGAMAFTAAYLVGGLVGGMSTKEIFAGFPSSLFVLIVGVTLLFAVAENNGTVKWITGSSIRLVRGRVAAIPWLMFLLAAVIAGVGALGAASVAIVAPVAMRLAVAYRINALMMGIMVSVGSAAGSFSPISPFGTIVNGVMTDRGLQAMPARLFLNTLLFNIGVAALVFLVMGGLRLVRQGLVSDQAEENETMAAADRVPGPGSFPVAQAPSAAVLARPGAGVGVTVTHPPVGGAEEEQDAAAHGEVGLGRDHEVSRLTLQNAATLLGFLALLVGALVFDLDVGLTAISIALALSLLAPSQQSNAVKQVPWSVVLLIAGILTYVGVLDKIGTIDYLGQLIAGQGNSIVAALAAIYVGAIISAFAATSGVLVASIPLAVPILEQSTLSAIGLVSAIAIGSSIVDSSPLSTNGALLLANQQSMPERKFFRGLLVWAVLTILVAPVVVWIVFVVL